MSILFQLHDGIAEASELMCEACGDFELVTHDEWPEPFCPDGCEGIHVDPHSGALINDNGHPVSCTCPGICDPDSDYDRGR